VLASIFHHQFEKIHPFMDGNGRTGRILFNFILIKHKYPPIVIHNKNRSFYLEALRIADSSYLNEIKNDSYFKLIRYLADEMISSYWDIFL
jgi:Fic family protein